MGLFDFFRHKKNVANDKSSCLNVAHDDLCSDAVIKKHFLIYMLLDPENCYYHCYDLYNDRKDVFLYKHSKIYFLKENAHYETGIFSLFIMARKKGQNDFVRIFEILNRAHKEESIASMALSAYELCDEIRRFFPDFDLVNNPQEILSTLQWAYADICVMHKFISEASSFLKKHLLKDAHFPIKDLSECKSEEDLKEYLVTIFKPK